MKKFLLFMPLCLIASVTFSQTLFTYGSEQVSKAEFVRAYNKNNTSPTDKNTALREYLDLYIKFKLKVKAAHDLRIDTLANINSDLQNFRSQIEEGYLNDEKEVTALVDEAFSRSQKDIHLLHLFIPFATPEVSSDTLKIYKAAQDAYDSLVRNSFGNVTQQLNNKLITASWGDVGFITVFSLPYEFENIVYQLRPGQVSQPYRYKNGYHLFKNIEERKAAGKIKIAQILIAVPPGSDAEQKNSAQKLADSVYKILQAGANFFETARAISNDKNTYMNGGVMPEFGTGKFDPAFESKAFALQKDSDITAPFQTSYGYHILKRLGSTPVSGNKNDAEYLSSLKQQVEQDSRISLAKEKFLTGVLKTLEYKTNTGINENTLWRVTDSMFINNKKIPASALTERTPLFWLDNNKITVADWLKFVKGYKGNAELYKGEADDELMKKFISTTAFGYYRKKLEYYNPDFKYQLQEFKDGNMLFEIMERNVWSRASADSAGLVKFFNQNKTNYYWKESADVIIVTCANEKLAKAAYDQFKAGKSWHKMIEDNSLQIQADSGRYELTQVPVKLNSKLTAQTLTEPFINDADGTASFIKVIKIYPGNQPRNFDEARGLVINDYQNLLEQEWIQQLKNKYPVKVNENVLQSLLN